MYTGIKVTAVDAIHNTSSTLFLLCISDKLRKICFIKVIYLLQCYAQLIALKCNLLNRRCK
jgi:hypothetical protein